MKTYRNYRQIGRDIEFRGLRAQYIVYAIILLAGDMVLFAILYICGLIVWASALISLSIGILGLARLYRLSNRYGANGLHKKKLAGRMPFAIRFSSRHQFIDKPLFIDKNTTLKNYTNETDHK